MGKVLANIIGEAEKIAGVQGRLLLANLTGMTTSESVVTRDTPELTEKFRAALVKLKRLDSIDTLAPAETAETLRKYLRGVVDLITQRSVLAGDVLLTAKRVTELAAETLNVARVSVWKLNGAGDKITSVDLYEREQELHSAGVTMSASDYGPYFVALNMQSTIAAHHAQTDPRTSIFAERYLKPLGITSMLDVPIWVGTEMKGVVCHEHIGPPREWNADEEKFAYIIAGVVSMAVERAQGW